ncbi:nucleotidyl transferase AbiEii/AbiGii toxin family protein [Geobacter sp.]|uniref:nucleotidyl transferase AbiEii/AbiGii toxin family protein n=1 Tax=Geobacter sp. TaxID=46610 RepID=UPI00262EEA21|nr:nucleotidyl transferase AbiEii/AbiGii toxin family protein [Geobacter sp.]
MSLFDQLVSQAMKNQGDLAPLQVVVEKELLHHDIIREMSNAGLLAGLTFIGGTCLRACYGSNRLSEDLDFAGGENFRRETLNGLAGLLVERLQTKYGLSVEASEPTRDTSDVDTWKLRVITRPGQKGLPAQRINIDICAIPSYDRRPMVLRNYYGVDMGTSGLIVQAQSREEILADKLVAFALRPNRLKNRDLWDIGWLRQQNVDLPLKLVPKKVLDHRRGTEEFLDLLAGRKRQLRNDPHVHTAFIHEMKRFLPASIVAQTVENEAFWEYLTGVIETECDKVMRSLTSVTESVTFKM